MTPFGLPGGVPNLNPHTVITEGGVVGLGSGDVVALPGFGVIVWGSSIDTAYCRCDPVTSINRLYINRFHK